jgi:tRNA1(Val) A37 N6-methylase TrmN6
VSHVTADRFLGGRLEVLQPAVRGHRAGLDAVLLGASVPEDATGLLVDLGAGVGVAGLVAAVRCPNLQVRLVENDRVAAALARDTVALNAALLGGRAEVVEADVTAPADLAAAGIAAQSAQHVILNPPFHPRGRTRPSPEPARARAHTSGDEDLERWLRTAALLCHPRGRVTVIYRADETPRLLAALAARFGGLVVLPVHPRADAPATRVIATGRPQARAPFKLLPAFALHGPDGRYTPDADAVLRGAPLPAS